MAIHSSILAWEIPWTEESGRLQTRGLQRVGYDLVTKQQHNLVFTVKVQIIPIPEIGLMVFKGHSSINFPNELFKTNRL